MDEQFQQLIARVQAELKATAEYQHYFRMKQFIDAHPEYSMREAELKLMQKDMVQMLNDQEYDKYQAIKTRYESEKDAFDNDPAIVEYQLAKEDLNDLLIEIAQLIESAINR